MTIDQFRAALTRRADAETAEMYCTAVTKKHGHDAAALAKAIAELATAWGIAPAAPPRPEFVSDAFVSDAPAVGFEHAWEKLAKKVGDDAANAMFEAVKQKRRRHGSEAVSAGISELLRAHGIEPPSAKAVAVATPPVVPKVDRPQAPPAVEQTLAPRKNRQTRATSGRKRRWSGKLNREVYPHYFPVPFAAGLRRGATRVVAEEEITTLFAEMPDPALRLYIYGCRQADKDGMFDMSAPIARKVRGVRRVEGTKARVGGDRYLKLLCDAGLFKQVSSGSAALGERRLASEFTLVPYSPELYQGAISVFRQAKEARRQALQKVDSSEQDTAPVRERKHPSTRHPHGCHQLDNSETLRAVSTPALREVNFNGG